MSKRSQRVVLWGGYALCSFLLVGMMVPLVARPTNCGGNTFALNQCRNIALLVLAEMDNDHTNPETWAETAKCELGRRGGNHWTGDAMYLVRTNLTMNLPPTTIVAVCNKPFGNVPQPMWWNFYRRTPAHAVARMDGTAGLISPAEFARMAHSNFIATTNFSAASNSP